jgi:hypothetical protein
LRALSCPWEATKGKERGISVYLRARKHLHVGSRVLRFKALNNGISESSIDS